MNATEDNNQLNTLKQIARIKAREVQFLPPDSIALGDVIAIDVQYLNRQDARAIRTICRQLRILKIQKWVLFQVVEQISKIASLEELEIPASMYFAVDSISKLKSLKYLKIGNETIVDLQLKQLSRTLLQLEKLEIRTSNELTYAGIKWLGELKRLRSFGLYWTPVSKEALRSVFQNFNHLTELSLESCKFQDDKIFAKIEVFKSLTKFSLNGSTVGKEVLKNLILHLPSQLSSIDLGGIEIAVELIGPLVEKRPHLKSIRIGSFQLNDYKLLMLCTKAKDLQYLGLRNCINVTITGMECLVEHQERLLILDLYCCCNLSDHSLILLSELRGLQELYLDGCVLADRGLIYLRKLRKLRVLGLKYNKLTEGVLIRLLLTCSGLWKCAIPLQHKGKRLREQSRQTAQWWLSL